MNELLLMAALLAGWIVLQYVVLPRLGVPTCGVPDPAGRRKGSSGTVKGQGDEDASL